MKPQPRLVLIGLGHTMRRDDGVGLWVARRIQARSHPGLMVIPMGVPDPIALAQAWEGATITWIVDAVMAAKPPGTLLRLRWDRLLIDPQGRWFSTHGISLWEAITLARMLHEPPLQMIVYGIVGQDFSHGEGLSPEVEAGAYRLLRRLEHLIPRILRDFGSGATLLRQDPRIPPKPPV